MVITSALHAEGLGFEPRSNLLFVLAIDCVYYNIFNYDYIKSKHNDIYIFYFFGLFINPRTR